MADWVKSSSDQIRRVGLRYAGPWSPWWQQSSRGSAHFLWKRPERKYFRLCRPCKGSVEYSAAFYKPLKMQKSRGRTKAGYKPILTSCHLLAPLLSSGLTSCMWEGHSFHPSNLRRTLWHSPCLWGLSQNVHLQNFLPSSQPGERNYNLIYGMQDWFVAWHPPRSSGSTHSIKLRAGSLHSKPGDAASLEIALFCPRLQLNWEQLPAWQCSH